MKRVILNVLAAALVVAVFTSCGGSVSSKSSADFLAKYDSSKLIIEQDNQAGIFIENVTYSMEGKAIQIHVNYKNPNIKNSKENMDLLKNRFFIADVRNPQIELPITTGISEIRTTGKAPITGITTTVVYYVNRLFCSEIPRSADLLMVGFKGIDNNESVDLATPPMYFVVQLEKDRPVILREIPTESGDFFEAAHFNEKFPIRYPKMKVGEDGDYYITVYRAVKGQDGKTMVEFGYFKEGNSTSDNIHRMIEKEKKLPFATEIIIGNKVFYPTGYGYGYDYNNQRGWILFSYGTSEDPDKITVINNQILVFDGKTHAVIQE